jgi:hypothetical protein
VKLSGGFLFLLLVTGALALWLGPRPVYEPWVAEVVSSSQAREMGLDQLLEKKGPHHAADLALANGIPLESLPALKGGEELFDADNDGDLDLFAIAHDREENPSPPSFYLNDGSGRFREVGKHLGAAFTTPRSATASLSGDFDRDGRVDLALFLSDGSWLVFWNRLEERPCLRLRIQPAPEESFSREEPVRVELEAGHRRQVQLVMPGAVAHFGLGEAQRVEKVKVIWPSGHVDELSGLGAGREHEITEKR